MADVKISGLPASTVPLAGTEVLPLVQGGITKQVSVNNLTLAKTSAFASLPAASGVTGQIYNVTDVGINGSLWQSNGTTWAPVNGVITLGVQNMYMIIPSSGSIGNNGALTGITALTNTAGLLLGAGNGVYMYFPLNAIATGIAAGWYYVVLYSTTAGTIYNNTYTSGVPTIPTSPTAFVTTGPGAYTQTTAAITSYQFTVIGNTLGANGAVFCVAEMFKSNASTASVYLTGYYGGQNLWAGGPSGTGNYASMYLSTFRNAGVTNRQHSAANYLSNSVAYNLSGTVDTTVNQTLSLTAQIANAADFLVISGNTIQLIR